MNNDKDNFELSVSQKILEHYNGSVTSDLKNFTQDVVAAYEIQIPMTIYNEADGSVFGGTLLEGKSKIGEESHEDS